MLITGTVGRVIYSGGNGWAVFTMKHENDNVTCAGIMPEVYAGMSVTVVGDFQKTPKYGEQFAFTKYSKRLPESEDAIRKFLSSKYIKGVSAVTAKHITDKFGKDTKKILDESPERLLEIPGISLKKLDTIIECWNKTRYIQRIFEFLAPADVTELVAEKIYEHYKDDAIFLIQENAYRLSLEVDGFGFIKSDKVALGIGYQRADHRRIDSALNYILMTEAENNGDLYLKENALIAGTQRLLGFSTSDEIIRRMNHLLENDVKSTKDGFNLRISYRLKDGERYYYYTKFMEYEDYCVNFINKIKFEPSLISYEIALMNSLKKMEEMGVRLSGEQLEAVKGALENRLFVISGGPGTGKTTILKVVGMVLEELGLPFSFMAPTGKASRRITGSTGFDARTIHSNIALCFSEEVKISGTVVVDEFSMGDLKLIYTLFKLCMAGQIQLLFVGDYRQLPPVGLGDFFNCLVHSLTVKKMVLTNIFRQKEGSGILTFIDSIFTKTPVIDHLRHPDDLQKDAVFIQYKDKSIGLTKLVALYRRLTRDEPDTQIITCKKDGEFGINSVNKAIQQELNPESIVNKTLEIGYKKFRVNDRVIITKNDKERDVSNGDVGVVRRINFEEKTLEAEVDGKIVTVEKFDELELAYAITVHKSQGSEYAKVIFLVYTESSFMLNLNMLLTGASRGKKGLIIQGEYKALMIAMNKGLQSKRASFTLEMIDAVQPHPEEVAEVS